MTTVTSQIRSVIGDLHALLSARGGLVDVAIFQYAPSPRYLEGVHEHIVLATRVSGEQSFPMATNAIKYDEFTLHGVIFVERPGAGDDVADETHERIEALLAEIEDEVRADPSIGRSNTEVQVGAYEHTYGADDQGRQQSAAFELNCRTRNVSG